MLPNGAGEGAFDEQVQDSLQISNAKPTKIIVFLATHLQSCRCPKSVL
jgi:hypothetical protein